MKAQVRAVTDTFGPRGRALWDACTTERPDMGPASRVLLEEACHLADRLERWRRLLAGDEAEWAHVRMPDDDRVAVLVVTDVVDQARADANALRQALSTLGLAKIAAAAAASPGEDPLDELARQRAARIAAAAGS